MEDSIILTRLAFDNRPLRKLTRSTTLTSPTTPLADTSISASVSVLNELDSIVLNVLKLDQTASVAEAEKQHFEKVRNSTSKLITSYETNVLTRLKKSRTKARQIRQQRQEYDRLTKKILNLPSREETLKEIESCTTDISNAEEEYEIILKNKNAYASRLTSTLLDIKDSYGDIMHSITQHRAGNPSSFVAVSKQEFQTPCSSDTVSKGQPQRKEGDISLKEEN